jgi:hypothetical protein
MSLGRALANRIGLATRRRAHALREQRPQNRGRRIGEIGAGEANREGARRRIGAALSGRTARGSLRLGDDAGDAAHQQDRDEPPEHDPARRAQGRGDRALGAATPEPGTKIECHSGPPPSS